MTRDDKKQKLLALFNEQTKRYQDIQDTLRLRTAVEDHMYAGGVVGIDIAALYRQSESLLDQLRELWKKCKEW